MSETQRSYTPDSGHTSPHDAQMMGQSLTSNGTESTPHQDQFQGLFAAGVGSPTFEDPGPEHWQPMSIAEAQSALKKFLVARPLDTEKVARWMKMLAAGPSFTVVINTAINVHALQRCVDFPDCFDVRGKLRVPWLHILLKKIKNARSNPKSIPLKPTPLNQTKPPSQARILLGKGSEESRSSPSEIPTEDLCQKCRLRPISDHGQSNTLCSDCAKSPLKSTKAVQKYGKQKNNKRLKMSDNSELVPAVPETPQTSTRLEVRNSRGLSPFRGTRPSDPMELPQSPDPLGFERDAVPSSRKKQDISNKLVIKLSYKEAPSSVPESQDTSILCSPTDPDPRMVAPIRNTSVPDSRIVAPTRSTSVRDSRQLDNYDQVCTNCKRAVCICSPTQKSPQSVKSTSEQPLHNGQSSPTSMATISIEATPLHGRAWLDHEEEICQPLERLTGLLSSYAGTALRLVSATRVPLLDLACIRSEDTKDPLVPILRGLLEIHEGVSIRAHIKSLSLEEEYSMWVKVIMMSLIKHFVFESGSPFEDTTILKKGLSYSKHMSCPIDEQDTNVSRWSLA
jgi:hypothetical protein